MRQKPWNVSIKYKVIVISIYNSFTNQSINQFKKCININFNFNVKSISLFLSLCVYILYAVGLICWKPPNELPKEEFIVTKIGVTMTFQADNGDVLLHSQIIPIICYLEHQSMFKLDKYLNFGETALGSTRTQCITITNNSETEEFHFLVITNTTGNTSPVGTVYIKDGQYSGVLRALQSIEIMLEFAATSIGKFEQDIWVNNLNDYFDTKRTTVSATVTVPSSHFIEFPDLYEIDGKYKPIEMGLIQIPWVTTSSSSSSSSVSHKTNIHESVYKLRISNRSNRILVMTAVSNLRKQCFIFTDEKLETQIVSIVLRRKSQNCIYIVLRPSPSGSYNFKNDFQIDYTDMKKGRELQGGIRMVFHDLITAESLDNEKSVVSYDLSLLKKLFETTIGFKAIVGSSFLSVKIPHKQPHYVCLQNDILKSSESNDSNNNDYISGEFYIQNQSQVFPLQYRYNVTPSSDINNYIHFTSNIDFDINNHNQLLVTKLSLIIFDEEKSLLNPLEGKTVKYKFYSKSKSFGYLIQNISITNLYTGEETPLTLSCYFNSGYLSNVPIDQNEQLPLITLAGPIWLATQGQNGQNQGGGPASPTYAVCGSTEKFLYDWHIQNNTMKSLMVTPISDLPIIVQVCIIPAASSGCCIGTSGQCRDPINNDDSADCIIKETTLFEYNFPADNMNNSTNNAIIQKKKNLQFYKRDDYDRNLKPRSSLLSFSKNTSGTIKKCGKAFSIPAQSTLCLRISVNCNSILNDYQIKELGLKAISNNNNNNNTSVSSQQHQQSSSSLPASLSLLENSVPSILDTGCILPIEGCVGLLRSESTLKDIFQPNTNSNIENEIDHYLSMEYYSNIKGGFIQPKLIVTAKNIDLGTVGLGFQKDIDLLVLLNNCDDYMTVKIEDIPNWLVIKETKNDDCEESFLTVLSNSSVSPMNSDSEDVDSDHHFNMIPNYHHHQQMSRIETIKLLPREKKIIEAFIKVPEIFQNQDIKSGQKYHILKQILYIRNANLPPSKLDHYRQEISMKVEI